MEEALRQFNAELQARNAELDAFAHTVAHDIKNPLHLLIGYADVLAENYARLPAETIVESLRFILKSGRKLNSITDNLLLLSQVRQTGCHHWSRWIWASLWPKRACACRT